MRLRARFAVSRVAGSSAEPAEPEARSEQGPEPPRVVAKADASRSSTPPTEPDGRAVDRCSPPLAGRPLVGAGDIDGSRRPTIRASPLPELADGEASRRYRLFRPVPSVGPPGRDAPGRAQERARASEAGSRRGPGSARDDRAGPRRQGPGLAATHVQEADGYRVLTLRFPLAPTDARPPLLGGALERLRLPTSTRWSAIDRALSACASPEGEGALIALDTETTGVSTNSGTIAFLIGVAWIEGEALVVEQWLLQRLAAEGAMLRALGARVDARLGPRSALVTFNGASFDLPLLRARFARAGQSPAFLGARHLDLLLPARRLWQGEGPDCRLTTLERRHLGVVRRDDVEGHAIPQAFWRWLEAPGSSAASAVIDRICAHNQVDLITLPALAEVIAATLERPQTLVDALRVARLERARGADTRVVGVLEPWLPPSLGADLDPTHPSSGGEGGIREPPHAVVDDDDASVGVHAPRSREDAGAAWQGRALAREDGARTPEGATLECERAASPVSGEPPPRPRGLAHAPVGRHALGGVRERMAWLGIDAGAAPRSEPSVRRIRAHDPAPASVAPPGPRTTTARAERTTLAPVSRARAVVALPAAMSESPAATRREREVLAPTGGAGASVDAPAPTRGPASVNAPAPTRGDARGRRPPSPTGGPLASVDARDGHPWASDARDRHPPAPLGAANAARAAPAALREAWAMAARALRRLGEDRRAAGLWAAICRAAPGDAEAHEALAKLLEHRLGDLPRALAVTLASPAPSPRRLARLRRKLAKRSHGAADSVYG